MTQTISIKRQYKLQFDGKLSDYIELANQLSIDTTGFELDSLDAGDATGFWLEYAHFQLIADPDIYDTKHDPRDGIYVYTNEERDFTLTMIYDDDSFIWDPPIR